MAKLHPSIAEEYPNGVPPGTCLYQSTERDENGEPYLLACTDVVYMKGPVGPQGPIPGHTDSPAFGYVPMAQESRKVGIVQPPDPPEVVELEPVHPIVTQFDTPARSLPLHVWLRVYL